MAKTAVDTLISELKQDTDYNITDSDLDTLILGQINKSIKRVKNLLKDYGISRDITANASFKTTDSVAYVDITKAAITGDLTTFTGVASDKIDVSIDGTDYDNIDISGDTTVQEVADAINAATSGTQASVNGGGYLVITSATTGAASAVSIDDDGAASEAVDRLFSVTAERTQSAITDLDEIIRLSERTNDAIIEIVKYSDLIAIQPDPTSSEASTPDTAARHYDRIYFEPTPSSAIYIYLDYYKLIADVAAGGTMPFEDKYDVLITAMVRLNLVRFFDDKNATALADFKGEIKDLKDELIINTAKNIGMNQQTRSRKDDGYIISPRRQL